MGDSAKTLLGNQFAGFAVDSICLVLDTHKRVLQVGDELGLTLGESACLLFSESRGSLFQYLESGGRCRRCRCRQSS